MNNAGMASNRDLDRDSDTAVSGNVRPDAESVTVECKTGNGQGDDSAPDRSRTDRRSEVVHEDGEPRCPSSEHLDESRYETSRFLGLMTPKRCRWDPASPSQLRMPLAYLYALVSAFSDLRFHGDKSC